MTRNRTMRILLLLTALLLITACESTNDEEVSQAVGQFIIECKEVTSDLCSQIPIDPEKNTRVGEVEIIDPTSAKVYWQWEWGERLRQKYEITVLYEEESWSPTQIELIEQVRREEEIVDVEPKIEVQYDSNLLVDAAHVYQFGSLGTRLIVKEINGINEKSRSEEIISDEITTAPTDWVVIRGRLSKDKMVGDVARLVRNYFANYQAGNLAALSELAPEAANYHYQADFYLTDFEVAVPESIKISGSGDEGEPERANIEGAPITEPFTLSAQVPAKISYSLFGLEFEQDETLELTWSTEKPRWTMPFWGITRAVALGESLSFGKNAISLDGIATTHSKTLVALTVSRNLPTTITIEGYGQQDDLLFKLPRAYKWINKLPDPDQSELMITINSAGAPGKILNINLNQSSAPNPVSGVQGRVEWGPTCGNPSTENPDACGNIPYQAKLTVASSTGLVVVSTTSDADGFYRIELPPGQYTLIPESSEFMESSPIPFTVNPGELTYIPIIYPSMIP